SSWVRTRNCWPWAGGTPSCTKRRIRSASRQREDDLPGYRPVEHRPEPFLRLGQRHVETDGGAQTGAVQEGQQAGQILAGTNRTAHHAPLAEDQVVQRAQRV